MMGRWTKTLLALLALSAGGAATSASDSPVTDRWTADPEEQYLLDVRLGSNRIGDGVRAYPTPEGACIVFGDFLTTLDVPLQIDLEALDRVDYPAVLKTRRFGYDGKGQAILRDPEDLERAWQRLGGSPLVLEAFVPFEAECSLIGVRGRDGSTRFWPLTRNVHEDGILALSLPGVFDDKLQADAERIMARLMDELEYVGVLTIEFFLAQDVLLVNEFAPRVHNSGHWTIDGAAHSQFENHLRAMAGLPIGATEMTGPSLMFNWIGGLPALDGSLAVPGLHWHDYGKQPRPGRKVGHATVTASSMEGLRERADQLAAVAGGRFPALVNELWKERGRVPARPNNTV